MTDGLAMSHDRGPEAPDGRLRAKRPLYPALLRLKHLHLNAGQRAVLGEGMAVVGALLAMADLASAWSIVVLPVAVAVVVKANDVIAGLLHEPPNGREAPDGREAWPAEPPT